MISVKYTLNNMLCVLVFDRFRFDIDCSCEKEENKNAEHCDIFNKNEILEQLEAEVMIYGETF